MILLLFVFLFPLSTLAQWGTPPPVVTNQQCQEEQDKIFGCVRNSKIFSKVDDIPIYDKPKAAELVDEITHVLDCSGFLNCNSSRILQSYFFNQRWIQDQYQNNLEHCLTQEGTMAIISECITIPENSGEKNCNLYTENLKCQTEALKKQPNCGPKDVQPYKRFLWAVRSGCVMMHQWQVERENYQLKMKGRFDN